MIENDDKPKAGRIPGLLSSAKEALLDTLFPIECISCGAEGEWFCEGCSRLLRPLVRHSCPFCGKDNASGAACRSCSNTHALDGIFAAGDYDQKELSDLVKKYKYSLVKDLSKRLSSFLIGAIEAHRLSFDKGLLVGNWAACPIPLHDRRLRWRGFNQSQLIAETIAPRFGWERLAGLKRIRNTKPQAKTEESKRMGNLSGCFSYDGPPLNGRKVILIDDVSTTGATLEIAAKTLKESGASTVWGLTVAKG